MKSIFAFLFVGFFLMSSTPINNDVQQQIFQAYTGNNTAFWKKAIQELKTQYEQEKSNAALFELVKAQYGFIGHCSGTKQKELAQQKLPIVKGNITQLLAVNDDWAEVHAIMSSLYGLEISFSNSFKSMSLGRKSLKHINKAIALDESSPIVCVHYANSKFHAPKMFGGSLEESIKYYEKSLSLFEKQSNKQQNWMYMEALAVTGLAYESSKEYDKAAKIYERALSIAPQFLWISEDLYPKLQAKR